MDQSFPGCCFVNKMCLVFVKKLHLCKYLSYEMRCLVVSNYRHKLCLAFFFVMIREKTKQNKTKQNKTKTKSNIFSHFPRKASVSTQEKAEPRLT